MQSLSYFADKEIGTKKLSGLCKVAHQEGALWDCLLSVAHMTSLCVGYASQSCLSTGFLFPTLLTK